MVVGKEEETMEQGGLLLQALELSVLKQEAEVGLLEPKVEKREVGEGGKGKEVPLRQVPGLIGLNVPKQEMDVDILKPELGKMEVGLGDYIEEDSSGIKMLEEETKKFCFMINRGDRKFEIPGARFPGTPSNCLDCALQDYGSGRLRGTRAGYNCESNLSRGFKERST